VDVRLTPVDPLDHDAFFAMFAVYHRELDAFDPTAADDPWDPEGHRRAMLADMEGRELSWIQVDGRRAGFVVTLIGPDWPDESRDVATISEFYVAPEYRRRRAGSAAVETLLADHRARGTYEVEASILRANAGALRFWERQGFHVRFYQTARKP
jgi:ribosomal protein S18 acetylase RimI-like enzyme